MKKISMSLIRYKKKSCTKELLQINFKETALQTSIAISQSKRTKWPIKLLKPPNLNSKSRKCKLRSQIKITINPPG